MKYRITQGFYPMSFEIDLPDDLEFTEFPGLYNGMTYLCVTDDINSYTPNYHERVYCLSFGMGIVSLPDVKFQRDQPTLISMAQMNQKLERIRKEVVYKYEALIYKLVWIDGSKTALVLTSSGDLLTVSLDLLRMNFGHTGTEAERIWEDK